MRNGSLSPPYLDSKVQIDMESDPRPPQKRTNKSEIGYSTPKTETKPQHKQTNQRLTRKNRNKSTLQTTQQYPGGHLLLPLGVPGRLLHDGGDRAAAGRCYLHIDIYIIYII